MSKESRSRYYKWFILIIVVVICNLFILRLAIVYGSSMEQTLNQHDCVLVWQFAYQPHNGDIVVTDSQNAFEQSVIKRVIATEGQKVSIQAGQVFVDDELLEEEYVDAMEDGIDLEVVVPIGQVFLMGDNRDQSTDSRQVGCFPSGHIVGKVIMRVFPFHKIKLF